MSIERGSLLYQTGRFPEAEQQFRSALVEEPANALAHAMVGLCLLQAKNYAAADNEARQAIGLRPDWYLGYSVLASILSERERVKPAVEAINKAIELNPFEPGLHATLAGLRLKQRDWQAALAAADAGLEIDPEHTASLNVRGVALVNLGRRNEAGQTLQGALQRNPHDAITHANQGWTLLHAGEHKAALIHFREALRIDPNLKWAKAGIVEAMNARNIVYRMMLKYFLFMSRLPRGVQWGIVIGGYFGQELLGSLAVKFPAIAPYVIPILLLYLVFVLLTWLAVPLFNLMLRIDRFGRYALSRDQTVASNWVGGLLLAGIVLFGIGFFRGDSRVEVAGLLTAVLSLPTSAIFNCPRGWPRIVMTVYTSVLAAAVVFVAATPFLPGSEDIDFLVALRERAKFVVQFGIIGSGIMVNALSTIAVRR